MPWFVDILAGLLLAVMLYWLVRFRMVMAPRMRDRYGNWARWSTWAVIIVLMIVISNLELLGLRQLLHERFGLEAVFIHELLFALVALIGGYFLVSRYATRDRGKNAGKKSSCTDSK